MLLVDELNSEPVSHDFALPAGAKLFEFEIQSVLGYTGFGITYRATDMLLREAVAIKVFRTNLPSDWRKGPCAPMQTKSRKNSRRT